MATYKVPQDVEADDKLLGPFTFRQFIYLIIVALAGFLAYALGRLFIMLAIIPVPIILFFGALALPLRKDQPMETYVAAMISFYLKPHRRLWDPDGQESTIEITAPKVVEASRTKDLSRSEAEKRFSYLAQIVDSQGWAVRGPGVQAPNSSLNSDIYYEAQQTEDLLDSDSSMMHNFGDKLSQSDNQHIQDVINKMRQSNTPSQTSGATSSKATQTSASPSYFDNTIQNEINTPDDKEATVFKEPQEINQQIEYNPYPNDMRQSVVQPIETDKQLHSIEEQTPSAKQPSADIINLAKNTDLSVATIAKMANQKAQKSQDGEVFVSLR